MIRRIKKFGGSFVIVIGSQEMDVLSLSEGDLVEITLKILNNQQE